MAELIPGGSKVRVTNDTKLRYLDALAQHRLASSIRNEVDHFLRGLNELIPDNLLGIFDENELEVSKIKIYKNKSVTHAQKRVLCDFISFAVAVMRDWRVQRGRFTRASHSERKFSGISPSTRLVLDGGEQFYAGGDGTIAPIHYGLLAITAWWISTIEPSFSDYSCTNVR